VKCWGWNFSGVLGDGTSSESHVPVQVVNLASGVTAIALGGNHACAVVADGMKCWGNNMFGQLGDNTTIDKFTPVQVKFF
jgi:alpha-tubulin suppressor-like RCC1 family protein